MSRGLYVQNAQHNDCLDFEKVYDDDMIIGELEQMVHHPFGYFWWVFLPPQYEDRTDGIVSFGDGYPCKT